MLPTENGMFPHYRPYPGRYYTRAWEAARLLFEAASLEPQLIVLPQADAAALSAGGNYEARVSLPAESYLLGFSATSSRAAGFEVQVTDLGSGASLFNRPVLWKNVTGQGTTSGITSPVFYLPKPRLILEPAVLTIRLKNLDTSNANTVQLVLHVVEPPCRPLA